VAEEQASKGENDKAEASWTKALTLAQEKGTKDSRIYLSALELAKVLQAEKKSDDARKMLRQICSDDLSRLDLISAEEISCVQIYGELAKEIQDTNEVSRADILLDQLRNKQKSGAESPSNKQVSILFGAAAQNEFKTRLAKAHDLLNQKEFTGAEKILNDCLEDPNTKRDQNNLRKILSEQSTLYEESKDYKKGELTAKKLLELAKQHAGTDKRGYLDALQAHSRLLRLTGQKEQAAIEDTIIAQLNADLSAFKPADGSASATANTGLTAVPASKIQLDGRSLGGGSYRPSGKVSFRDLMSAAEHSDNIDLLKFVAHTLFQNHDYAAALPYVEKLVNLSQPSVKLQTFLCALYIDLHRPNDAIDAAKRAVFISHDPDTAELLVASYSNAGDVDHHKSALQDYLSDFPNGPKAADYKSQLEKLEKVIAAADKTDYSAPTDTEQLKSWKKRGAMPIRVYLADNTTQQQVLLKEDGSGSRHPRELCEDALNAWASASGGRISFSMVPDEPHSQISIGYSFATDALLSENGAAGITKWSVNPFHASVSLELVDSKGRAIKRETFYATALHEIGHALGLDHSKRPEDVMFWQQHSIEPTAPSNNDERRIGTLYSN